MARRSPSVVRMSCESIPLMAELWIGRRISVGASADAARRAVDEGRFARAVDRDDVMVLLALLDDDVVGYVWVSYRPLTAQLDTPSFGVEDLYVVPTYRGQGIARALLTAAVSCADQQGIGHVTFSIPSQDKDGNRTLARLGFAAAVTRRIGPTALLMRRLRGPEPRGGAVDRLLVQRRRRAQRLAGQSLVAQS